MFEARRARLRERREAVEVEPRHVSELGCRRRHGEGEASALMWRRLVAVVSRTGKKKVAG